MIPVKNQICVKQVLAKTAAGLSPLSRKLGDEDVRNGLAADYPDHDIEERDLGKERDGTGWVYTTEFLIFEK